MTRLFFVFLTVWIPILLAAQHPLRDAARSGDLAWVFDELNRDKSQLNAVVGVTRETPLIAAIEAGHAHVVQALLDLGADAMALGHNDRSPLHYAVRHGRTDIAMLLLLHGARIDAQNRRGDTPLHTAAEWGQVATMAWLVGKGANPALKNDDGQTPADLGRSLGYGSLISRWNLWKNL